MNCIIRYSVLKIVFTDKLLKSEASILNIDIKIHSYIQGTCLLLTETSIKQEFNFNFSIMFRPTYNHAGGYLLSASTFTGVF